MELDLDAWPGLVVDGPVAGGHRNEVWVGSTPSGRVAIRRSRRSAASLQWELDLLADLDQAGFVVPLPLPTRDGRMSCDGVVVQRWIDGREPATEQDWRAVGAELLRLHGVCAGRRQRPDCVEVTHLTRTGTSVDADLAALPHDVATAVLAVFVEFADAPVSVVHGDPASSNIRITPDGHVGLLDWDESRVDVVFHDLSNLGVQVLSDLDHQRAQRLSSAWEAANAWTVEPEYAKQRLHLLRHA